MSINPSEFEELRQKVDNLETFVNNLHQECQRLYQTGFANGVEVARKECADEFKKLEDRGLISCHGFLRDKTAEKIANDIFDQLCIKSNIQPLSATKMSEEGCRKWAEEHVDIFQRSNVVTPHCSGNCMNCSSLISHNNLMYNTIIFHCEEYNKSVQISKDELGYRKLQPDDFKKGV